MNRILLVLLIALALFSCAQTEIVEDSPWEKHGKLVVEENSRIISYKDGTPFIWLGCTAWGMTELLSREDVNLYLDDRLSKGMNVVQICLLWGKRVDYPTKFTFNDVNPYGHRAFKIIEGSPDVLQPDVVKGGSPEQPNDYWDHVDYCLKAIKKRGMYAAVMPFWGRRYVNASHNGQSLQIFNLDNIFSYGKFLGSRYGEEPNLIWVNGGDVNADVGGNYLPHYRLLAEGLVAGVTGKKTKWNQKDKIWDELLVTYHPSGTPMINSSEWFHNDAWLDFNMIETHIHRNFIAASIRQDLAKKPLKPTIMAEGHYEGKTNKEKPAEAIHIRRQAYQTFFAGAAGFTYGGGFDEEGNGPLFSPSNNWKHLLNWEGAGQMMHLRKFLEATDWHKCLAAPEIIKEGRGEGELEKLAVQSGGDILVYFPENKRCILDVGKIKNINWYNTKTGENINGNLDDGNEFQPPAAWEDGILIIKRN